MTFLLVLAAGTSEGLAATAPAGSYLDHKVNRTERRSLVRGTTDKTTNIAARMLLPAQWSRVGSGSARSLRFQTDRSCRSRVTLNATVHLAADSSAVEHLGADLPASSDPLLLEDGTRGRSAYRVVRVVRPDRRTQVVGKLVRPLELSPDGRRYWAELEAVTLAKRSCHSGSYRNVLAPQLAVALNSIRFTGFSIR